MTPGDSKVSLDRDSGLLRVEEISDVARGRYLGKPRMGRRSEVLASNNFLYRSRCGSKDALRITERLIFVSED